MKKPHHLRLSLLKKSGVALMSLCCLFFAGAFHNAPAQSLGPFDRDNARAMLDDMKDDIKKNYYDPNYHGLNLEEHFKKYDEFLKQAQTRDELMLFVAQALLDFDDSHTTFWPPSRAADVRYGWIMQMFGRNCYVTAIQPKSDAEAKGLKVGDKILSVDGFQPARENIWKMIYRYYDLMPSRSVRLVVQSPDDKQPRQLDILSKIERRTAAIQWDQWKFRALRQGWFENDDYTAEVGKELLVWKMTTFSVEEKHIDAMMGKARNFQALIIDLRGNGGGYVKTLERLVGYFFDHDLKISDEKGRKEIKPSTAKTRGSDMFKGRLIVLVDSDSASAAEVFARIMQLEKRGTIIGDKTAGAVMTARYYDHQTGNGDVFYYGASVTIADAIMPDGKSLEKTGVVPDEVSLPTGADLAAERDPVLARAGSLIGLKLTAEEAGKLFPLSKKTFFQGRK